MRARGRHAVSGEASGDPRNGNTSNELLKDSDDDGRLRGINPLLVAVRPGKATLVDPNLANRHGLISVRPLANVESTLFLPALAAVRPIAEVRKGELIDDPAELNRQLGPLVRGIEAVGNRDHPDVVEAQFREGNEHVQVVAREARQIIDEDNVEQVLLRSCEEREQARSVLRSTGLGMIGVDVRFEDGKTPSRRLEAASGELILDALLTLILRGVAGVQSRPEDDTHQRSFRESRERPIGAGTPACRTRRSFCPSWRRYIRWRRSERASSLMIPRN